MEINKLVLNFKKKHGWVYFFVIVIYTSILICSKCECITEAKPQLPVGEH